MCGVQFFHTHTSSSPQQVDTGIDETKVSFEPHVRRYSCVYLFLWSYSVFALEHLKVFFHLLPCGQELQDLAKKNGAAQPLAAKGGGGGGGNAEVRRRFRVQLLTDAGYPTSVTSLTCDSDMLGPQYVPVLMPPKT